MIISRIELENGVYRDLGAAAVVRNRLALMAGQMAIVPFGADALLAYGNILAACGYARSRVFDRMIAAQAISLDATLITINGADFRDIPGLKLEIWSNPGGHQGVIPPD